MSIDRLLAAGLFALLSISCGNANRNNRIHAPQDTPNELLSFTWQFLTLHDEGEPAMKPLLECFEWEKVTETTRDAVMRSLYFDFDTPIRFIQLEPWKSTDMVSFFGDQASPNLEPGWIMHIHFQSSPPHILSLPIGKTDSGYRIVNPIIHQSTTNPSSP